MRLPVVGFVVTRAGTGEVRHRGAFGGVFGDDFSGLAPYFLPTLTVPSVLTRPLLGARWFPAFDIWIGGTFGYYAWTMLRETRGNRTGGPLPAAGRG